MNTRSVLLVTLLGVSSPLWAAAADKQSACSQAAIEARAMGIASQQCDVINTAYLQQARKEASCASKTLARGSDR